MMSYMLRVILAPYVGSMICLNTPVEHRAIPTATIVARSYLFKAIKTVTYALNTGMNEIGLIMKAIPASDLKKSKHDTLNIRIRTWRGWNE
jgi:hypothetical protein